MKEADLIEKALNNIPYDKEIKMKVEDLYDTVYAAICLSFERFTDGGMNPELEGVVKYIAKMAVVSYLGVTKK